MQQILNFDDYLQMNVEMGSWSDDPEKNKQKIKKAIGKVTTLKKALLISNDSNNNEQ